MIPTDEQLDARDLFVAGDSMVIEAGAGTGKTSTLRLLAASTRQRGRYLAFNRAIVDDTRGRMPARVECSTAHSLAFRSVGKDYAHRLDTPRQPSWQVAEHLGLERRAYVIRYGAQTKTVQPGYLAGWVMRALTRFCQSADEEPTRRHFPYIDGIDIPDEDGSRTYEHNDQLRELCEPALHRAWADICRKDGQLRYSHDAYLKQWQLSHPRIHADFVLFDEAQDANPVMAAVVAEQDHAQQVYVGDSAQAIYEFTGAIDAITAMRERGHAATYLSQSFRFGPAIAEAANTLLELLGTDLRLRGLPTIDSWLDEIPQPDALLCRTNAGCISNALRYQANGTRAHVVGGGREVLSFAKAAAELIAGGTTGHPELACFDSWQEVLDYVEHDAQGIELRLQVRLVEEFGTDNIEEALGRMVPEDRADVVISTAHKAKGREWPTVRLGSDFGECEQTDSELRLQYVACTRAREGLDATILEPADTQTAPVGEPDAEVISLDERRHA